MQYVIRDIAGWGQRGEPVRGSILVENSGGWVQFTGDSGFNLASGIYLGNSFVLTAGAFNAHEVVGEINEAFSRGLLRAIEFDERPSIGVHLTL